METETYTRKPIHVEAVQVTEENLYEVAAWCDGEVIINQTSRTGERYIKVKVNNPLNVRQTKAFVGDWVLKSKHGFKCYTPKAFEKAFEKPEEATVNV